MNTTTTRKMKALVDFRPGHEDDYGIHQYFGRLVSQNGTAIMDRQLDGQTVQHYLCRLDRYFDGAECRWQLTTQGWHKGSRRYRRGTFTEMIEAAEKWAARRFYSEADA